MHSRLCSCHFVDGLKSNGPTIFDYGRKEGSRQFQFTSPEKRRRKRYNFCMTDYKQIVISVIVRAAIFPRQIYQITVQFVKFHAVLCHSKSGHYRI